MSGVRAVKELGCAERSEQALDGQGGAAPLVRGASSPNGPDWKAPGAKSPRQLLRAKRNLS